MSLLTIDILCYLVCTVIGFKSPEVNLWHCTALKMASVKKSSWKIFYSNISQNLFFCNSEKGWDYIDPSEVPRFCMQRPFQCPVHCSGCIFM